MQKARDKLKADEILLEAAKAKERQRSTKEKIKVLWKLWRSWDREQRRFRKKWRESSKKYRQQKSRDTETQLNTPPDRMQINPQNDMLIIPSTSRVESGRKVARNNLEKLRLNLKNVEIRCKKFESKAEKYGKKYHWLLKKIQEENPPEDATPRKKWHPFFKVKILINKLKEGVWLMR